MGSVRTEHQTQSISNILLRALQQNVAFSNKIKIFGVVCVTCDGEEDSSLTLKLNNEVHSVKQIGKPVSSDRTEKAKSHFRKRSNSADCRLAARGKKSGFEPYVPPQRPGSASNVSSNEEEPAENKSMPQTNLQINYPRELHEIFSNGETNGEKLLDKNSRHGSTGSLFTEDPQTSEKHFRDGSTSATNASQRHLLEKTLREFIKLKYHQAQQTEEKEKSSTNVSPVTTDYVTSQAKVSPAATDHVMSQSKDSKVSPVTNDHVTSQTKVSPIPLDFFKMLSLQARIMGVQIPDGCSPDSSLDPQASRDALDKISCDPNQQLADASFNSLFTDTASNTTKLPAKTSDVMNKEKLGLNPGLAGSKSHSPGKERHTITKKKRLSFSSVEMQKKANLEQGKFAQVMHQRLKGVHACVGDNAEQNRSISVNIPPVVERKSKKDDKRKQVLKKQHAMRVSQERHISRSMDDLLDTTLPFTVDEIKEEDDNHDLEQTLVAEQISPVSDDGLYSEIKDEDDAMSDDDQSPPDSEECSSSISLPSSAYVFKPIVISPNADACMYGGEECLDFKEDFQKSDSNVSSVKPTFTIGMPDEDSCEGVDFSSHLCVGDIGSDHPFVPRESLSSLQTEDECTDSTGLCDENENRFLLKNLPFSNIDNIPDVINGSNNPLSQGMSDVFGVKHKRHNTNSRKDEEEDLSTVAGSNTLCVSEESNTSLCSVTSSVGFDVLNESFTSPPPKTSKPHSLNTIHRNHVLNESIVSPEKCGDESTHAMQVLNRKDCADVSVVNTRSFLFNEDNSLKETAFVKSPCKVYTEGNTVEVNGGDSSSSSGPSQKANSIIQTLFKGISCGDKDSVLQKEVKILKKLGYREKPCVGPSTVSSNIVNNNISNSNTTIILHQKKQPLEKNQDDEILANDQERLGNVDTIDENSNDSSAPGYDIRHGSIMDDLVHFGDHNYTFPAPLPIGFKNKPFKSQQQPSYQSETVATSAKKSRKALLTKKYFSLKEYLMGEKSVRGPNIETEVVNMDDAVILGEEYVLQAHVSKASSKKRAVSSSSCDGGQNSGTPRKRLKSESTESEQSIVASSKSVKKVKELKSSSKHGHSKKVKIKKNSGSGSRSEGYEFDPRAVAVTVSKHLHSKQPSADSVSKDSVDATRNPTKSDPVLEKFNKLHTDGVGAVKVHAVSPGTLKKIQEKINQKPSSGVIGDIGNSPMFEQCRTVIGEKISLQVSDNTNSSLVKNSSLFQKYKSVYTKSKDNSVDSNKTSSSSSYESHAMEINSYRNSKDNSKSNGTHSISRYGESNETSSVQDLSNKMDDQSVQPDSIFPISGSSLINIAASANSKSQSHLNDYIGAVKNTTQNDTDLNDSKSNKSCDISPTLSEVATQNKVKKGVKSQEGKNKNSIHGKTSKHAVNSKSDSKVCDSRNSDTPVKNCDIQKRDTDKHKSEKVEKHDGKKREKKHHDKRDSTSSESQSSDTHRSSSKKQKHEKSEKGSRNEKSSSHSNADKSKRSKSRSKDQQKSSANRDKQETLEKQGASKDNKNAISPEVVVGLSPSSNSSDTLNNTSESSSISSSTASSSLSSVGISSFNGFTLSVTSPVLASVSQCERTDSEGADSVLNIINIPDSTESCSTGENWSSSIDYLLDLAADTAVAEQKPPAVTKRRSSTGDMKGGEPVTAASAMGHLLVRPIPTAVSSPRINRQKLKASVRNNETQNAKDSSKETIKHNFPSNKLISSINHKDGSSGSKGNCVNETLEFMNVDKTGLNTCDKSKAFERSKSTAVDPHRKECFDTESKENKPVEKENKPVEKEYKPVEKENKPVEKENRPVESVSNLPLSANENNPEPLSPSKIENTNNNKEGNSGGSTKRRKKHHKRKTSSRSSSSRRNVESNSSQVEANASIDPHGDDTKSVGHKMRRHHSSMAVKPDCVPRANDITITSVAGDLLIPKEYLRAPKPSAAASGKGRLGRRRYESVGSGEEEGEPAGFKMKKRWLEMWGPGSPLGTHSGEKSPRQVHADGDGK